MRDELSELRQEEIELEQKVDSSRHQVTQLDKRLTDTQSQISQVLQFHSVDCLSCLSSCELCYAVQPWMISNILVL